MTAWLAEHWGDLVVVAALFGVLSAIVAGMIRRRRSGPGCCCGCSGCRGGAPGGECGGDRGDDR